MLPQTSGGLQIGSESNPCFQAGEAVKSVCDKRVSDASNFSPKFSRKRSDVPDGFKHAGGFCGAAAHEALSAINVQSDVN